MPVNSEMKSKAIDNLKMIINSRVSYIDDEQILTMMAHRAYDDYVPGFEDGWELFKTEKGDEENFVEMTAQLRTAMIHIAVSHAGFSQEFAKELVEAVTSE